MQRYNFFLNLQVFSIFFRIFGPSKDNLDDEVKYYRTCLQCRKIHQTLYGEHLQTRA